MSNINYGKPLTGINIKSVEMKYGAKYIGDFALKTKRGAYSEVPASIFYNPNPNLSLGHSHYFGIFRDFEENLFITRGDSAFEEPISAAVAKDGEIIYSRYRHDFRSSTDGSVTVDGGRDYTRVLWTGDSPPRMVQLVIKEDKLEVLEEPETPQENHIDVV